MPDPRVPSDAAPRTCPDCGEVTPAPHPRVVRLGGTVHRQGCPQVPGSVLSPETQRELQAALAEIDACQRRAWAKSHTYFVGGGGD